MASSQPCSYSSFGRSKWLSSLGVLALAGIAGIGHWWYGRSKNTSKEDAGIKSPTKPKSSSSSASATSAIHHTNQSFGSVGHCSGQPFKALTSYSILQAEEEEKTLMESLFGVSTVIVTLGVPGSGRATLVDTLRPWLGAWGFQTRHLTLANVLGQGYASGGYSQDQVEALQTRYKDLTSVDATAYVRMVCQKAWERSRSPTVFTVSDLTSEAEIRYLKQLFGKVFVLHLTTSSTAKALPFADTAIANTGSKDDLVDTARRYFASTLLPALKEVTSLDALSKDLKSRAFSYVGGTYYDTNSFFANPSTLFSCMYIFSSLLKTMNMQSRIDAIVAVSAKAVPLTTCLAYMLRKPNPSLLYHTHVHDDLVPYPVEWAEGDSAGGHFAVGWAPHFLGSGSRVLLVDDILATGRRAEQVGALAKRLDYEVVSLCVLFALDSSNTTRTTLDFPVVSLLSDENTL